MRRVFLYLILMLSYSLHSLGQFSPTDTLFTINNTAYPSQAFLDLYNKQQILGENREVLPLKESLQLYINFHLKAYEAKRLQIDTLNEVKNEFNAYQDYILESHLYPVNVSDSLINEAFLRIQHFLKARHILIKIEGRETPKDTLEAYLEAIEVREELIEGKRFEKLARQHSDDLSARVNNGEIGYFTAFDMDYNFESAAYSLRINEISKPIRSPFGYHIIQVLEKIPNPGKVQVRHLMLELNEGNGKTRKLADSIHQLILEGKNMSHLVKKYSKDETSVTNDGILPWFGLFETHASIERAAFQLNKTNKLSPPIKTEFGYHILELLDKKEYTSLERCKADIISAIKKDDRSQISQSDLITKIKKKYNFKENRELLTNFYSILDYAYADLWEPLFTLNDKKYTQEEFAEYLIQQPSKDIYEDFKEYINRLYVSFSNNSILAFHKNQLISSNLKIKTQVEAYKNGILVYFITKKFVWEPSADQNGLKKFFEQNRGSYNKNATLEQIKNKVLKDYRDSIKENWIKSLRNKNKVIINKSTFAKIAKNEND